MIAGHIEIRAVTEDISIDLIRLKDLIADQSSQLPQDEKAVLYNMVESVSQRMGQMPDKLQTIWVQWKAGLDAAKKANQLAIESLKERMKEVNQREIDLAKDAEKFEENKRLAEEKLREVVGMFRAVEKKEKLVAMRERRVANLEEFDAFNKSLKFGMDGAVDDESEVDIVVGKDLPIAAAKVKGNGCSICSSKGTFGSPEKKPVVDRDPSVESSNEEQVFEQLDLDVDGTMEHAADAAAAQAKEYFVGADIALEDLANAAAAHEREIDRLNRPGKNESPLAQVENAVETPTTAPEKRPDDGTRSNGDPAFLREESLAAREESLWNRDVVISSREKQIWGREHSVSASEQAVTEREERLERIKAAQRRLNAVWNEQSNKAFGELKKGFVRVGVLHQEAIDARVRAEAFRDEVRLLIQIAKKLAEGSEGGGKTGRGKGADRGCW